MIFSEYKKRQIRLDPNDKFGLGCFSVEKIRKWETPFWWWWKRPLSHHWEKQVFVKILKTEWDHTPEYIGVDWVVNDKCQCDLCTGKTNLFSHKVWSEHNLEMDRINGDDLYSSGRLTQGTEWEGKK